jgi:hypothetical protein
MTSSSVAALARSYRGERVFAATIGLLAITGGAGALVVGTGLLGGSRSERPVLDPVAVDAAVSWPTAARVGAIVLGVLLVWLGLATALRTVRPEAHPDLPLDHAERQRVVVTSAAVAAAVAADAEQVEGVSRARATFVGERSAPALRLSLWLRGGTSVRDVWQELDDTVLRRARESLGIEILPTAVRLELGSGQRRRVR